jgi:Fe-S cluster assembly ATP-binding protein
MSADDLDPPKLAGHGMPLLEIENLHVEIDGKKILKGVDLAVNAQRKKRGEAELSTLQFVKKVRDAAGKLGIDQDMLRRAVNVGFSGGEKKRSEILQMALLEPRLAVLDCRASFAMYNTRAEVDISAQALLKEFFT